MKRLIFAFVMVSTLIGAGQIFAQEESEAPDPKYTWDLTEIFPTEEAWDQARNEVLGKMETILARRGTMDDSAEALYETLALVSDTQKQAYRVYTYASLKADEDLRVSETQERRELAPAMLARMTEATSWMQPEILRVGEETISSFIAEDERLQRFAFELDNALRNAPHTLGDEAEETLAYFSQTFAAPNDI